MSEPQILFLSETPDGTAKIGVMQVPGAGPVILSLEVDGQISVAKLSQEQAIGLAASILSVNVELLAKLAERFDQRTAQEIAAALLVPTAAAALLDQATRGETPQ